MYHISLIGGCTVGFLQPTSGNAIVAGFDIQNNLSKVREKLGLCPQYNIIYETLTVEEHLRFFGRVRPLPQVPPVLQSSHPLPNPTLPPPLETVHDVCIVSVERVKGLEGGSRLFVGVVTHGGEEEGTDRNSLWRSKT